MAEGRTTPGHAPAKGYFPALDGLRGVAFLLVFSLHYLYVSWGWAGVDVFFVLSGFLITGILLDTEGDAHRLGNFYVRRALRIFPLFYGLILVLVLAAPLVHWDWGWDWLLWPLYLGNVALYLPVSVSHGVPAATGDLVSRNLPWLILHLGHLWSLCVEEQFYLVWPWVLYAVKGRRRLMAVCAGVIVVTPLLRVLAWRLLPEYAVLRETMIYSTPFRLDGLMAGALLALLWRGYGAGAVQRVARLALPVCALAAAVWLYQAAHPAPGMVYPFWRTSGKISLMAALSACVLVRALDSGSWIYAVLKLPPLRFVGRISYGAYILHELLRPLLLRWLRPYFPHRPWAAAGAALAVTLLLAWASFRWYERPFLRMKERLTRAGKAAPSLADVR